MVSACQALLALNSMQEGRSAVPGRIIGDHGPWSNCCISSVPAVISSMLVGEGALYLEGCMW